MRRFSAGAGLKGGGAFGLDVAGGFGFGFGFGFGGDEVEASAVVILGQ
jgi:hypothetical protein